MIYFVRADEDGPVKIGWSKNIPARMNQVRPTPDTVLTVIRLVDREEWVERWFHGQFSETRLTGEWFTYDDLMLTLEPPVERPTDIPGQHIFRVHLTMSESQLAEIDEWRRRQTDIPPRAEAIRRLIAKAVYDPQRDRSAQEPT